MRGSDKRAVALEYRKGQHRAPLVTAKGKNRMAQKMEETARENRVPVMDIPHLAESLFKVDIGAEIPEKFYSVTADILSFIYSLEDER